VLVTSCPYCITNFEDSRMNREDSDAIEIKDITEIVRAVV
jgi:Fe-S oxidoreductase